jgi:hypothetical protein
MPWGKRNKKTSKRGKMRLNGWQRAWVVASTTYFICVSIIYYSIYNNKIEYLNTLKQNVIERINKVMEENPNAHHDIPYKDPISYKSWKLGQIEATFDFKNRYGNYANSGNIGTYQNIKREKKEQRTGLSDIYNEYKDNMLKQPAQYVFFAFLVGWVIWVIKGID